MSDTLMGGADFGVRTTKFILFSLSEMLRMSRILR